MSLWRNLNADEVQEFVQWARDNWRPGQPASPSWHPVVRAEWKSLQEGHDAWHEEAEGPIKARGALTE